MTRLPTVVIVSDQPTEQATLRRFLDRQGLSSISFPRRGGIEPVAAMRPDLVLLTDPGPDLRGSVCTALRARVPGVAIVLLSDEPESEMRARSADLDGAASALQRPIDYLDLHGALQPLLGGAPMRQPGK